MLCNEWTIRVLFGQEASIHVGKARLTMLVISDTCSCLQRRRNYWLLDWVNLCSVRLKDSFFGAEAELAQEVVSSGNENRELSRNAEIKLPESKLLVCDASIDNQLNVCSWQTRLIRGR